MTRPSISDRRPVYLHAICPSTRCAGQVRAHRLDTTQRYRWVCVACGMAFVQNPWVSDGHEMIDPPVYEQQRPGPVSLEAAFQLAMEL